MTLISEGSNTRLRMLGWCGGGGNGGVEGRVGVAETERTWHQEIHDTSATHPEAEAKVSRGLVVRGHLKTEAHDIFIKLDERHEVAGGLPGEKE